MTLSPENERLGEMSCAYFRLIARNLFLQSELDTERFIEEFRYRYMQNDDDMDWYRHRDDFSFLCHFLFQRKLELNHHPDPEWVSVCEEYLLTRSRLIHYQYDHLSGGTILEPDFDWEAARQNFKRDVPEFALILKYGRLKWPNRNIADESASNVDGV